MSSLAIPTHVARRIHAQKTPSGPAEISSVPQIVLPDTGKREKVNDVDTPIPEGLPSPGQWRVTLMPVGQRRRSKGSILFCDETMDVQDWTHMLWKVCKVGPFVHRGPAWQGFTEEELQAEMPKPGEIWLVDPKNPRRYHYKDILFIVVNDDQLWSKVDPRHIEGLKFRGLDL